METTQGSSEKSTETLEEFLARDMDISVDSLQEKSEEVFIEAPWEAEVVQEHE